MDRSARWATTNRANIAHYFQRHKEMKLTHHSHESGFTLAEILTATAIADYGVRARPVRLGVVPGGEDQAAADRRDRVRLQHGR